MPGGNRDASIAFYRRLGVDIPDHRVWRTATGAHHAGVATRHDVDRLYGAMTQAGHRGLQAPHDAFWGARYAIVEDPDGIAVGVMSPISAAHRAPPPEV